MIKLFLTANDYTTNGDKIINPLKAVVHNELNGEFYIEIETDISYAKYLDVNDRHCPIIIAPTPEGEQMFRVLNIEYNEKKISFKAKHITFDADGILIKDSYVVKMNAQNALNHLSAASTQKNAFNFYSDIETIASYRCVRNSLSEAIETVQERWGGYIKRDNRNISLLSSIGSDKGVTVRYGKNLSGITCETNWDDVVTVLLPTGTDGIMLNKLDSTVNPYIQVDNALMCGAPMTKTVDFDQDIDEEDYEFNGELDEIAYKSALITDLRSQATKYLHQHFLPEISYTVTAANLPLVNLGDTVDVEDERFNMSLRTQVTAYDYDCLTNRQTSVEFGNFTKKLSKVNKDIKKSVRLAQTAQSNVKAAAYAAKSTQASISTVTDNVKSANRLKSIDFELDSDITQYSDSVYFSNQPLNEIRLCFSVTPSAAALLSIGADFLGSATADITVDSSLVSKALTISITASAAAGGLLIEGTVVSSSATLQINSFTAAADAETDIWTLLKFTSSEDITVKYLLGKGTVQ